MAKAYAWPIDEMARMYNSGMSLQEIADELGGEHWTQYWMDNRGHEYKPSQKVINKVLKRSGVPLRGRGAPMERNTFWKGGVVRDKSGYVLVKTPGHPYADYKGYVRQHRLVMEQTLGRYLLPHEVVHHKDGNTSNNHPENLEIFHSNSDHISATTKGKVPPERANAMMIAAAKKRLEWWPSSLLRQWYCEDLLTAKAIGLLIHRRDKSVLYALKRMGISVKRGGVHRRSNLPTSHHVEQASQFLASVRPQS